MPVADVVVAEEHDKLNSCPAWYNASRATAPPRRDDHARNSARVEGDETRARGCHRQVSNGFLKGQRTQPRQRERVPRTTRAYLKDSEWKSMGEGSEVQHECHRAVLGRDVRFVHPRQH